MAYSILLRPAALHDLRKLPDGIRQRIEFALDGLAENPRPSGCKKLVGFEDEWRLRAGDYRVLYVINDSTRSVTIARIAHRREAYR